MRDEVENFRKNSFGGSGTTKRIIVNLRQTNSLTPFTGMCGFFLQVKLATSLLTRFACRGITKCRANWTYYKRLGRSKITEKNSMSAKFMDGIVERRGKSGPW